ncbi:unnamed protein product [Acanthoscelides obtectus]|uniref:Uncharacterized protein n=1 Tax=Acanthoscelides obtectus TaxID=200917 RepID=A0A9P0LQ09_ACAOB|nr:unnamed protein product [Acanthoscelides obtectus]CAK1679921.1 hypothetical protein AOBTE_LOCUS32457 [Acanthoscelides obtectus]
MKYVSISLLLAAVVVFSCILTAQALECYSCSAPLNQNSTCVVGNLTDALLHKCDNGTNACMVYDTGNSIVRQCAPRNQTCTQYNATSHMVRHCRTCSTDKCNGGTLNGAYINTASYSVPLVALAFSAVISKLY